MQFSPSASVAERRRTLYKVVMAKPEVFIGGAVAKFDAATGACTHETTRKFVGDQMQVVDGWIATIGRMRTATRARGRLSINAAGQPDHPEAKVGASSAMIRCAASTAADRRLSEGCQMGRHL